MKKQRFIAIISLMLCFMMVLPSCKLRRKGSTAPTEEEETEEESDIESEDQSDAEITDATAFQMNVTSLDQFISDGSIFAENVPIPTPTPIPVNQTSLGLTNDVDGYFSGPLQNATVVDNEFFRFTIISSEVTADQYIINAEIENKSDVPYKLRMLNPVFDNGCAAPNFMYESETIEPHQVLYDVTNFALCAENYAGVEPTRLAFLLLAIPSNSKQTAVLADPVLLLNYIPVTLYPQGEDAFHYEERPLDPNSTIVLDNEGAQFVIDSFELQDKKLVVNYTFINKTTDYIKLQLEGGQITIDQIVFETGIQALYIPPYGRQKGCFEIRTSLITDAGLDPAQVKTISIPLQAKSLNDELKVLWDTVIKKEIDFG